MTPQVSAALQLLTSVYAQEQRKRTITEIYHINTQDIPELNEMIRRALHTKDYLDAGFNPFQPELFGNLARYALVRKQREGIDIPAQGHLWRRILRDCSSWPTDARGFRHALDGYLSQVEGEISQRTGRRLSPQSYNNLLGMLQSIWSVGVSIEIVESNPITSDRYPRKRTKPRKRTLTRREIVGMLWALRRQHRGLYWAMRFCLKNPTGYGDLRRLRCRDVDIESQTVGYARKKTRVKARPVLYPELLRYAKERVSKGYEYLFDLPHDYRHAWNAAKRQSGTTDLTWHDLRHHAATWLAQRGIPLHIIAALGGWSTVQMVERYHDLGAESAAKFAREMLLGK